MTRVDHWLAIVAAACIGPGAAGAQQGVVLRQALESELRSLNAAASSRLAESATAESETPLHDAIRDEEDPRLREAMWSQWLDRLARAQTIDESEARALRELVDMRPVVMTGHHEARDLRWPAFRVASRARAMLARRRAAATGAELAADPQALRVALRTGPNAGIPPRALQSALRDAPAPWRRGLAAEFAARADEPRAADAVIALFGVDASLGLELARVVAVAPSRQARRALRAAIRERPENFGAIAEAALLRPDIGGLVIEAKRAAGSAVDAFCWPLLSHPHLGGDAARALADDSQRLEQTIRAEFDGAARDSRLRMLLALKLRDTERSLRLLSELADSPSLTEQQRREVAAWLR
ncbi:MAG: hypothetical protein ACNS61_03685 [Candidatus Wenzhouxiangella sp. M2_3B_020]